MHCVYDACTLVSGKSAAVYPYIGTKLLLVGGEFSSFIPQLVEVSIEIVSRKMADVEIY